MADYSIYAELGLDSKGFEKGVKKAQSSLSNFSSGIKTVTKALGSLFAIGSIVQFTKEIGKMASSFNDARAEIVKGTGATGRALEELSQSVTDALQNGVGRSAQEIGGMVADLNTRFGVMGNELTGLVDKFDMFSSVTGTDTRNAINSVADVMSKWGVETEQTGILLDQLTVASQESGASVEELEAGLKSGQAIFSQFGMSVTQSTAFLATLKKNGIDTGQALTGMRTALAKFSQEGRNAKTAFKETSESIKNAKTETEALQIATEIFGTRSGAEMVRVLRSGSMSVDEMASKLMNASGALKETDEASRTVKDALDDLKARFTALFSAFSGDNTLRDIIDRLGEAIGKINLEEVESRVRSFITTLVNLANNIGGIIKTIYGNFKELFNTVSEMLGNNEGRFEVWKDNLYSVLDSLYRIIQDVFGLIKAILQGDWEVAWQYAKLAVMRAVSIILDNISTVANMFPNLINTMIKGINKLIEGINKVREFFGQDMLGSLGEFTSVDLVDKTGLGKAIEEIEEKIEELTGKTADIQIEALDNVSTKRKEVVEETKEGEIDIQGVVAETAEEITEIEEETANKKKKINEEEKKDEQNKFKEMLNYAKTFAKNVSVVIQKIVSTIKSVVTGVFNFLQEIIDFNVSDALDTILEFEDGILTFFVETLPKLPSFVASVLQSIGVLLVNLKNYIKAESISDIIFKMLTTLGENLPTLISDLLDILENLINGALDGLIKWLDGGGLVTILNLILKIQQTIEKIFTDNLEKIVNLLADHIDDFANFLADSMTSAQKTLPKIVRSLNKLVLTLIQTLAKVFENEEFINSFIEAIEEIVKISMEYTPKLINAIVKLVVSIIKALVPKLPEIILTIVNAIVDAIPSIFTELVSSIGQIFGALFQAIFTEEFWLDLLGGLWDAILNIFGSFGKLLAGNTDGTASEGEQAGNVIGNILTGGLWGLAKGLFGWANGTNDAPKGLALVGEAGPELVHFNGGEQVLNTRNTQKALANAGGSSNTFNVNFTNVKDTSAYALVSQLKQYNRQMAINGVL